MRLINKNLKKAQTSIPKRKMGRVRMRVSREVMEA